MFAVGTDYHRAERTRSKSQAIKPYISTVAGL